MHPTGVLDRLRNAAFLSVILTVVLAGWIGHARAVVPPIPTLVEGPITGPGEMHPGIRPGPDGTNLGDFGYVTEEYFVSGTAAGQPYKTRILIRKPPTPSSSVG